VPHPSLTCFAPKPGWLVRPGTVLDGQDELVLNALVGGIYGKAYESLGPFQGDPDVAYQLNPSPEAKEWIRTGVRYWDEWRTRSSQRLNGAQFVVVADVTGFYENIDLERLRSDLKPFSPEASFLDLLMSLLHRWAQPRAKGVPQGFSAGDILAKIYLNPIDRALRNGGFTHLRYVDDIRIFCKSRLEAKRGLLLLNDLMRKRGLNLQTAKTKILRADEAAHEIDGVTPLIKAIQSDLVAEMSESLSSAPSSVTVSDIEQFFQEGPEGPRPEVLEQAFQDNFGSSVERFNKTLLHYLLTRLAKAKSHVAATYAIELIQQKPEETEWAPGQSHLEIRSQQNHRSCGTIKERSRIRGEIYRCRRAEITRLVHPGDASGDLAIKIKCVLVEKRSCISALFSNAIALEWALRYLLEVGTSEAEDDRILDYISSAEAIYDYQTFQIIAWFVAKSSITARLLQLCRAWAVDKNKDLWLRTAARSVLGLKGDQSDLEAIEGSYETIAGDLERADVVDALARMETSRRNSFFGRVSSDGELVSRAVRRVRAGAGSPLACRS